MRDALTSQFLTDGWVVVPQARATRLWSEKAFPLAQAALANPELDHWFRHGRTWFAGVDVLPNASDGSLDAVALAGPALTLLGSLGYPVTKWHKAQISAVYPGYPIPGSDESEAASKYRRNRDAAHVDGLLPVGPDRRRFLKEPHAFILGLPLTPMAEHESPLAIWQGSHQIMRSAFHAAFADDNPGDWSSIDVTEVYHAARREVFARCPRVAVTAPPGAAILVHRLALHGIVPWTSDRTVGPRILAYFRPIGGFLDWLALP